MTSKSTAWRAWRGNSEVGSRSCHSKADARASKTQQTRHLHPAFDVPEEVKIVVEQQRPIFACKIKNMHRVIQRCLIVVTLVVFLAKNVSAENPPVLTELEAAKIDIVLLENNLRELGLASWVKLPI
jgi:hypothetical protein